MQTTAACPAFAYTAEHSATVVDRLLEAGAILIGKTNLDQFQSGLVGTRTPYGIARNLVRCSVHPRRVELRIGGRRLARDSSASRSGPTWRGSGRVPAAFNNVIGLKPSRGLVSAAGCVPAARSLDCISVFSLTAEDALAVLRVAARAGPALSLLEGRRGSASPGLGTGSVSPSRGQEDLEFFGNFEWGAIYQGRE